MEKQTTSVTCYISMCSGDVTATKTITSRPNQKPSMTAEVCTLLKTRDDAFRAGSKETLKPARASLSHAIKQAKRTHGQRIHIHFQDSGNTQRL